MNVRYIDSLDTEELKIYTKCSEAELLHFYEPDRGVFIAETPDIIMRAIGKGCEPLSFLVEEKVLDTDAAKILRPFPDVPVFAAPLAVINRITGFNLTRGMLCAMRRLVLPTLDDILRAAKHLAVLDDVENPTNVGAIFRSAAALGADGVILTGGCADPFYRRSARVSMGAVFFIPWIKEDAGFLLERLKETGFSTIAMALTEKALPIYDPALKRAEKTAVLFGNERNGISGELLQKCDFTAQIPMRNGMDSLNVAAASAVAFYQFFGLDYQ